MEVVIVVVVVVVAVVAAINCMLQWTNIRAKSERETD